MFVKSIFTQTTKSFYKNKKAVIYSLITRSIKLVGNPYLHRTLIYGMFLSFW